jgi:putative ABC transport system permease protein
VRLFGLDSATLTGRPGKMLEGDSSLLTQEYAVVAAKANLNLLDNPRVGDTFEMNDNLARIVGIAEVWPDLQSAPFIFTTYDRALRYAPPERKQMSYILAAPADGVSIEEAVRNIRETTGLAAYSEQGFSDLTTQYILKNTGIPIGFGLSLMLAFLVGMAIVSQTFLQFALQNERYFGALKAMGTGNWTLVQMTLLQSTVVAVVGFGIGGGLASIIGLAAGPGGALPFYAPWQLMAFSFLIIVGICVVSSLLSVRKILLLEPAVVFK